MSVSSEKTAPDSGLNGDRAEFDVWLNDAKHGCEESLGRLLEAAHRYLLSIANQTLPEALRAKVSPSDLVQDTSFEAFKDFSSFEGERFEELLAWLRRILLNNMVSAGRLFERTQKRQISRETPLEGHTGSDRSLWAAQPTPSQVMMVRERAIVLEDALARLPHEMRTAIILRNREHLSFAEIGQQLERSSEAARKLWARAIERLQRELM
jgi:RNA polymerase sigma-70 factor (ECF subfamily)